jgi:hypothetical protein
MRIAGATPDVDGIEIEIAGRFISLWKATCDNRVRAPCATQSLQIKTFGPAAACSIAKVIPYSLQTRVRKDC